jgi:hypothetical protein
VEFDLERLFEFPLSQFAKQVLEHLSVAFADFVKLDSGTISGIDVPNLPGQNELIVFDL